MTTLAELLSCGIPRSRRPKKKPIRPVWICAKLGMQARFNFWSAFYSSIADQALLARSARLDNRCAQAVECAKTDLAVRPRSRPIGQCLCAHSTNIVVNACAECDSTCP